MTPAPARPYGSYSMDGDHAGPGRSAWADGRSSIFEPSWKENKMLFVFSGESKDYKAWVNRIKDHMCRSTHLWRGILDFVAVGTIPITPRWLMNNNCHGVNAWDLSNMLEAFIVNWLPKSMYNRRAQWAGGDFGNGFEMWRRMYHEFQGGTEAVEFGGVRRLQEFPRCNNISRLAEHLDDWLDVLTTYGQELEQCPRMLRNMVMGIIPTALEDEIIEKSYDPVTNAPNPQFRTYETIIRWCRSRIEQKRAKELSEFTRKPNQGQVKSLIEEGKAEVVPSWAKEILASVRSLPTSSQPPAADVPPPPETLNAVRPSPKPKAKAKAGNRGFTFKGCWHCGKDEPNHSRKNCQLFLKILKEANPGVSDRQKMKLPANYKGAYEKAREAAGLPVRTRRLNMLDDEDHEDDAESDFGDESLCVLKFGRDTNEFPPLKSSQLAGSPKSFVHPNSYAALANDEESIPDDAWMLSTVGRPRSLALERRSPSPPDR